MKKFTFSKILMIFFSLMVSIWITWSFVLASIGRDVIAEDLASQVVVIGLGAILGYFGKSFLETREEEKNKLDRELFGASDDEPRE